MLPLTDVTIKAFRGIRDLELNGLGRINLLVGENNCGKTSVLEALAVLSSLDDVADWAGIAATREGTETRMTPVDLLTWLFPHDVRSSTSSAAGPMEVLGHGEQHYFHLRAEAGVLERFDPGAGTRSNGFGVRGLEIRRCISHGVGTPEDLRPEQVEEFWEDRPIVRRDPLLWPGPWVLFSPGRSAGFNKWWSRLSADEQGDAVDLARMFDPDITGLALNDPNGDRSVLVVEHAKVGRAPVSVLGDGLQTAIWYAMLVPSNRVGLVFSDEVESSLHYSALRQVFTWLIGACHRYNVQLFATTHSLEAIDAILEAVGDQHDDVVLFHLRRDGDRTIASRLDGEELHRFRFEHGWDLR